MITIAPNLFENEYYPETVHDILNGCPTIEKGLVRFVDNVKNGRKFSTLSGGFAIKDYKSEHTAADASSDLKFSEKNVDVITKEIYDRLDLSTLRNTRFSEDMQAGAMNLQSNELTQKALAYATPKIRKGMEEFYWSTVVDMMSADADVIKSTGTVAVTASNIADVFANVYQDIPVQVLISGDFTILADESMKQMINVNNSNQDFRDKFTSDAAYLGCKIEYLPLGIDTILVVRNSDMLWLTDLLSDMGEIKVDFVAGDSHKVFFWAVFAIGIDYLVPTQKVIYKHVTA